MKNYLIGIGLVVLLGIGFFAYFGREKENANLSSIPLESRAAASASTTVFSVGHQLSVIALPARSVRAYASICNNVSGTRGYLFFSSDATLRATTTASVALPANSCYEIDGDNPWTGAVSFIQETSSSTASLMVSELAY